MKGVLKGALEQAVAARHVQGRLTAAERLEFLLDPDSFVAFSPNSGAIIAGAGAINGRALYVYAQDFLSGDGVLSTSDLESVIELYDRAVQDRAPIVALFDARGYENRPEVLALVGEILERDARASGVIARIAIVMGPCVGADALLAGASDLLFMVRARSGLFLTGPEVVAALTPETLSDEALGGAEIHSETSGLAAGVYDNDAEALLQIRKLVDCLPFADGEWKTFDNPARKEPSLATLVPEESTRSYDVKELILKILDEEAFFELQESFAPNIVIGFGRIEGRSVGVIANQSLVLAGALNANACRKAARFVALCGRFGIAIVSLIDVPGFLPGATQEHGGIARDAAKLLSAIIQAPVAKIVVILRNAIGAAALAMGGGDSGATIYAWPSARIALKGGASAPNLQSLASAGADLVDAIIAPAETRTRIVEALTRGS
jgi:propionyl-CoA carboxylase beta chain